MPSETLSDRRVRAIMAVSRASQDYRHRGHCHPWPFRWTRLTTHSSAGGIRPSRRRSTSITRWASRMVEDTSTPLPS
jgi:hypothetical protein